MSKRWTADENRTLRILRYQVGMSWQEVAEIMHRPRHDCEQRAYLLRQKRRQKPKSEG